MVNDTVKAPYADTPIPLYLGSSSGMRYRSLNCLECGQEFLERNNQTMFRTNDTTLPSEIAIGSESIKARCGNCQQWYGLSIAAEMVYEANTVPLHMQPESLYVVPEANKSLRYIHCLECGKAFHSLSDRISQVVDNRVPLEYLQPTKMIVQVMCHFNRCSQEWAVML